MDRLGLIENIPVYVVYDKNDVYTNARSENYYIFRNTVYRHGVEVGRYNCETSSVDWYEERSSKLKKKDKHKELMCETCHEERDHDWIAMMKPVDDFINEMLAREL